ncbi:MAG: alanine--tRNA ligase-related protein [Alphaproteobacteria bacterium]|nr:alanine--tRNA ligase-related protein [Alphaproteobacteria bacterium]
MNPTILTYMIDQDKHVDEATVVAVSDEHGRTAVFLDKTIFYPQGGGQAWDTGTITAQSGCFSVEEVRFADGIVHHFGTFTQGTFAAGDVVRCAVDPDRRFLNSRLHSAGHLLDEAVKNLGFGWTPTKGIHYPDNAAVEYAGSLEDAEAVKAKLQAEIDRLIANGCAVCATLVDAADLPRCADFVPDNLPVGKPVRVVKMGREKGTPCGGTHVKDIAEIGLLTLRYVKAKKGNIKVAYALKESGGAA